MHITSTMNIIKHETRSHLRTKPIVLWNTEFTYMTLSVNTLKRDGDITDEHGAHHPVRPPGMPPMMPVPKNRAQLPDPIEHSMSSCTPPPVVLQEAPPRKARRRDPSPYIYKCLTCGTINTGSLILAPRGSKCEMVSWWRYCSQ